MERVETAEDLSVERHSASRLHCEKFWNWVRRTPLQLLYTHNPFYVISAGLIFSGLRMSFDTHSAIDVGALTIGLTGYTLLLAGTAALLIRIGKVWDDTRSLLVLILLMFLGIAVTLDEVLTADSQIGAWYCLGGACFAAVVSEALLRGTGLRLNAWCRLVYHLLIAMQFLYPLTMIPRLTSPESPLLQWQLFGFVPVASLVMLLLLPAVRGGAAAVCSPGVPWRWPWFPWVLFGVLGGCVILRAYYLCLSLHFVGDGSSIFGPYFAVPLLLVTAVLLFEGGRAAASPMVERSALVLPAVAVVLCLVSGSQDFVYQRFLAKFIATVGGSPLYVTLLAGAVLYILAMWRRTAGAEFALLAALGLLSIVEPATISTHQLTAPSSLPLIAASIWLMISGIVAWRSWRLLAASTLAVAAAAQSFAAPWLMAHHGLAAAHLVLLAMLLIGAVFHDRMALWIQRVAAVLLATACLVSVFGGEHLVDDLPVTALQFYPLGIVAIAAGYGYLTNNRWFYGTAGIALTAGLSTLSVRGYEHLRHHVAGLSRLAWGILCFLVAAAISAWKAGIPQQWRVWHVGNNMPQSRSEPIQRE